LLTHAFFKALLFLGAGSVIHGCHEEQDIRRMGGLRRQMPTTFLTYAIGMMALSGVPLLFSGFWSKDEILHAASVWPVSRMPFYIGIFGAFLTAFYMTRQMYFVFFGKQHLDKAAHESPAVMTVPLVILAIAAILVGFLGTPAWPWLHAYLTGHELHVNLGALAKSATLMLVSTSVVALGMTGAWRLYTRRTPRSPEALDPLEAAQPAVFRALKNRAYIDEFYELTVIPLNRLLSVTSDLLDRFVWNGLVQLVSLVAVAVAFVGKALDQFVINLGFDGGCGGLKLGARGFARLQNGQAQSYLRVIGLSLVALVILLLWEGRR